MHVYYAIVCYQELCSKAEEVRLLKEQNLYIIWNVDDCLYYKILQVYDDLKKCCQVFQRNVILPHDPNKWIATKMLLYTKDKYFLSFLEDHVLSNIQEVGNLDVTPMVLQVGAYYARKNEYECWWCKPLK